MKKEKWPKDKSQIDQNLNNIIAALKYLANESKKSQLKYLEKAINSLVDRVCNHPEHCDKIDSLSIDEHIINSYLGANLLTECDPVLRENIIALLIECKTTKH